VLITTDSLLHAIHQTYDDLLIDTEEVLLIPRLTRLLQRCREQLEAMAKTNADPGLAPLFADLDIYLAVPLALLSQETETVENIAAYESYRERAEKADRITPVTLFGSERMVDFSLFKPRGHYHKIIQTYTYTEQDEPYLIEEPHPLQHYFRAMMWLSQIDFRLVEYDSMGTPHLKVKHLAAAALLAQAIKTSSYATWNELDTFLRALIGDSDNMTLVGLECFLQDAALETPGAILQSPDQDQILHLLTTGDYGRQRIAGQIQSVAPGVEAPVPQHVSFMLLGQRFAIDSYIMSNLVFDRLVVDGKKVERIFPSPLDVMYTLGNDRAETHLQEELAKYGYRDRLRALRQEVGWKLPTFWSGSIYHCLLNVLRTLSPATISETYPAVMRSAAWADKMLQTQLASWTQMRHDNMLYVKQSFTRLLCEYPAGYVEPYPACYAAMSDYARMGQRLFASLKAEELTKSEQYICQLGTNYFQHLETVTNRLVALAEKELAQESFSHEEEGWLKETAVRRLVRCGSGGPEEQWTGWYPQLFFRERWNESPALIADVHTSPQSAFDPDASVLHVATGQVATMPFIVNTDEGSTMYVGPAFTYYEVVTRAPDPLRLTDQEWKEQITSSSRPAAPQWTHHFRFSEAATRVQLSPSNHVQPRF